MVYRWEKSQSHQSKREWQDCIDRNRYELTAIGLPAEVYLDEMRWYDFLENGHLHWHDSSGFEFGELSPGQIGALQRFLEREYGAVEQSPPLLGWIRIRCGVA